MACLDCLSVSKLQSKIWATQWQVILTWISKFFMMNILTLSFIHIGLLWARYLQVAALQSQQFGPQITVEIIQSK